jgi:hypothetical protein
VDTTRAAAYQPLFFYVNDARVPDDNYGQGNPYERVVKLSTAINKNADVKFDMGTMTGAFPCGPGAYPDFAWQLDDSGYLTDQCLQKKYDTPGAYSVKWLYVGSATHCGQPYAESWTLQFTVQ